MAGLKREFEATADGSTRRSDVARSLGEFEAKLAHREKKFQKHGV